MTYTRLEKFIPAKNIPVGNQHPQTLNPVQFESWVSESTVEKQPYGCLPQSHLRTPTPEEQEQSIAEAIKACRKEFLGLRQGNTWYTASFAIDRARGGLKIIIQKRMCKGRPTITSSPVEKNHMICANFGPDLMDRAGSAAFAAGGVKQAQPDIRKGLVNYNICFGGKSLKSVTKKAELWLSCYGDKIFQDIKEEEELWADNFSLCSSDDEFGKE